MIQITQISIKAAKEFTIKHHYSKSFPPHTIISYGFQKGEKLIGAIMLGWGVRPKHTVQKLFPSLNTKDYLEINRFCLIDEEPKNTESQCISLAIKKVKKDLPNVKIIFTWADGLRGKPGYIYQASNFYYGGAIWSEFYLTEKNEFIHPRLLITRYGHRDRKTMIRLNLKKIRGWQFRYVYFLCSHKGQKRLIAESPFQWTKNYPKSKDLKWTIDAGEGSRETRQITNLESAGQFRNPAPLFDKRIGEMLL